MWHIVKYMLLGVLVTIMTASYALADVEIMIEGKGEGTYCGQETPEYVHTCVVQNGQKRYLIGSPKNDDEAKALENMREGTPVTFEFEVVRDFVYSEDGEGNMVVYVKLTGMRAK